MNRPALPRSLSSLAAAGLLLGLATTSTPAQAWDWNTDEMVPTWRPQSLNWAQDIAMDVNNEQIGIMQLQSSYEPPPREHWCVENPAPTQTDCAIAKNRLNNWIADFLELGPSEPIPEDLATYPKECASICQL